MNAVASCVAPLRDRGVVRASGADARRLLHDLVTADVAGLSPGEARLSALLTPQGKVLFDFMIACESPDSFLFDLARDAAPDLAKRLLFYRLRAKVDIRDLSPEWTVAAVWNGEPTDAPGLVFRDPRLAELGFRVIAPRADLERWLLGRRVVDAENWDAKRIRLGVPEGGRDFPLGDAFPHEVCFDQLGAVDFDKGCYVGQEVVSRMEHRGTARTRIVPVTVDGTAGAGETVTAGDKPVGRLGSTSGGRGLALLRLDRVADAMEAGEPLVAGSARVEPVRASWMRFPLPGEPGFGTGRQTGTGP